MKFCKKCCANPCVCRMKIPKRKPWEPRTLGVSDVMKAGDIHFGWHKIPAEWVGQKVGKERRGFTLRPSKIKPPATSLRKEGSEER